MLMEGRMKSTKDGAGASQQTRFFFTIFTGDPTVDLGSVTLALSHRTSVERVDITFLFID